MQRALGMKGPGTFWKGDLFAAAVGWSMRRCYGDEVGFPKGSSDSQIDQPTSVNTRLHSNGSQSSIAFDSSFTSQGTRTSRVEGESHVSQSADSTHVHEPTTMRDASSEIGLSPPKRKHSVEEVVYGNKATANNVSLPMSMSSASQSPPVIQRIPKRHRKQGL